MVKETFQDVTGLTVQTDLNEIFGGYRPGDPLELRKPDGCKLRLESGLVRCFPEPELVFSESGAQFPVAFFFRSLVKADIPAGTEIWQLVEHQPPKDVNHRYFERISDERE